MNRRVAQRQALRGGRQEGDEPEERLQREFDRAAAEQQRRQVSRDEERALQAFRRNLHDDLTLMENTRSEMQRRRHAGEESTRRVRPRLGEGPNPRAHYHEFKILFDENIKKIAKLGQKYSTHEQSLQKINLLRTFLNNHRDLRFGDDEGNRLLKRLNKVFLEYNRDEFDRLKEEVRERTPVSLQRINSLFNTMTDDEDDDDE